MSRLDSVVRSVPADPSSDNVDPANADDLKGADPEPTGNTGDNGDDNGKNSGGRTIENVRGETLRKLSNIRDELHGELKELRELITSNYGVPAQSANPSTLDDMSVQQLEQMRSQVPEDQAPAFEQYLIQRKVQEQVHQELNKFQSKTQNEQAAQRYNEQALERWPELRDKNSDLYRTTDKILGEMGEHAESPRAVLDAANEAGLMLGQLPSTGVVRRTRTTGRVAPGHRTSDPPQRAPEVDKEQQAQIISGLRDAMPDRTFSEDALKRIAEREKMYREDLSTRIRG